MLFHCYYFELDLKRKNNDYARVRKVGESLGGSQVIKWGQQTKNRKHM